MALFVAGNRATRPSCPPGSMPLHPEAVSAFRFIQPCITAGMALGPNRGSTSAAPTPFASPSGAPRDCGPRSTVVSLVPVTPRLSPHGTSGPFDEAVKPTVDRRYWHIRVPHDCSPAFPPLSSVRSCPVLACPGSDKALKSPELLEFPNAPVAQLDSASPSEGEGHRFESCRVRHRRKNRNKIND